MTQKKPEKKVLVMMATFNGERYIAEQVESIVMQEDVDVDLVISDDNSSDDTPIICKKLSENYSNVFFRRNKQNVGVASNFMNMVYEADVEKYDYFAFSDQDDVWLPNKLAVALDALKEKMDLPALYYSDICNVDADLENPVFGEYLKFSECSSNLKLLLVNNWASGCTMVFNQRLCKLLQIYRPKEFPRIHDSWVHLIALTCGICIPDLENAYIKRRITNNNVVGESHYGKSFTKRVITAPKIIFKTDHFVSRSAQYLLDGYSDHMREKDRLTVRQFAELPTSFFGRLKAFLDPEFSFPWVRETVLLKCKILLNQL